MSELAGIAKDTQTLLLLWYIYSDHAEDKSHHLPNENELESGSTRKIPAFLNEIATILPGTSENPVAVAYANNTLYVSTRTYDNDLEKCIQDYLQHLKAIVTASDGKAAKDCREAFQACVRRRVFSIQDANIRKYEQSAEKVSDRLTPVDDMTKEKIMQSIRVAAAAAKAQGDQTPLRLVETVRARGDPWTAWPDGELTDAVIQEECQNFAADYMALRRVMASWVKFKPQRLREKVGDNILYLLGQFAHDLSTSCVVSFACEGSAKEKTLRRVRKLARFEHAVRSITQYVCVRKKKERMRWMLDDLKVVYDSRDILATELVHEEHGASPFGDVLGENNKDSGQSMTHDDGYLKAAITRLFPKYLEEKNATSLQTLLAVERASFCHAEIKLALGLLEDQMEPTYIAVSKRGCLFCADYLQRLGFSFGGTDSKLLKGWQLPAPSPLARFGDVPMLREHLMRIVESKFQSTITAASLSGSHNKDASAHAHSADEGCETDAKVVHRTAAKR